MDREAMIRFFMGIGATREEAEAAVGGGGASGGTSSVYVGGTIPVKKTAGRPGSPVSVVTGTTENTSTIEESYLKFWKDPATKAKVMARLKLMGREELGEAGAYKMWKDTVDMAAEIYSSGKGFKITPLELLNLSAKKAAPEPQLPQRQVQPLERAEIDNFVDSIYLSAKGELASIEEKDKLFKEFEALNTGTVTTTKKVKNAKGILENVSTTTRGFNQDAAQAKIEAEIKKNNPLEYQRRKAFEFADEFSKVMSGGM
jgi:hypothetical protein